MFMQRIRYVLCCLLFGFGALQGYSPQAQAQSSLLDSLIAANSMMLRFEDGTLQGPGAEFILARAAESQFVALGEEHNTRDIPEFTTALFRVLQKRHGFRFLALEQDPVTMRWLSGRPLRGRREFLVVISRRYPHAFTFVSDEELAMLAQIGAISRTPARPVWGCDQAFGATHILDRLQVITRSPSAREFVRRVRDRAQEREGTRDLGKFHYMSNEPKSDLFAQLREAVRPKPGSETEMLVQSLIVSDRIYRNYREEAYYENAREREHYMKTRFLDEYRNAWAVEKTVPKVILKFGHWHLYRGLSPNNQQTLGNFVSEFATANDSRSFHLAIFPNNTPGGYGDLGKWRDPAPRLLARNLKTTEWIVVDLRPLRAQYHSLAKEMTPDVRDSFRRWIFGYDAALFMGGMERATYDFNPGVEY
jgi:hypothetical protein